MEQIIEMFLHLDRHLEEFIQGYGAWVYGLTFAIVFAETGLIVAPFLPGDSLLFALGALSARGLLNVWLVAGLLTVAAVLGDAVNYHIGRWLGPRVFRGEGIGFAGKLFNRKHLDRAHAFYEKYGGKAVVLGRFVPIVRTFVPFVAGAGAMNYSKFVVYNVVGAVLWVGLCVGAGYAFGNIPVVQKNFSVVVLGIVVVSVLPLGVEMLNARRAGRRAPAEATSGASGTGGPGSAGARKHDAPDRQAGCDARGDTGSGETGTGGVTSSDV